MTDPETTPAQDPSAGDGTDEPVTEAGAQPDPAASPASNAPRPRLVSCERCKQRKAKCDRQRPTCHRCEVAGLLCEYATRRKPGFPMGHRQALEAQIRELNAEVKRLKDQAQRSPSQLNVGGNLAGAPQVPTNVADSPHPVEPRIATPSLDGDYFCAASFIRTGMVREEQPPTELVVSRVPFYFRHINPWLPCLDTQRVLSDLTSVDQPTLLHLALFSASLPYSRSLQLGRFRSDSFWKYTKRRVLVEALEEPSHVSLEALAVLVLDLSGMTNGPQVWGPLAVAIKLAMHLETTTGRNLRLSTLASVNAHGGTIMSDQSYTRRLFWMIYALDCYISLTTGHASEILESSLHQVSCPREGLWRGSMETTASYTWAPGPNQARFTPESIFSYQLELLDLSRRIHVLFIEYSRVLSGRDEDPLQPRWFQSFMGCSSSLNAWVLDLPECLQMVVRQSPSLEPSSSPLPLPAAVMLSAYYHASTIFLNGMACLSRHPGLEPHHDELSSFCHDSFSIGLQSVDHIVNLVSSYRQSYSDKLGWPFAWSVWTAARFLLSARYSGEHVAPDQFSKLLECLVHLSKYWQISGHYARVLQRTDLELESLAGSEDPCPSALLQAVAAWHIPTANLEDQTRVDPLLPESPEGPTRHVGQTQQSGPAALSRSPEAGLERPWGDLGQSTNSWMYMDLMTPSTAGFPNHTYSYVENAPVIP